MSVAVFAVAWRISAGSLLGFDPDPIGGGTLKKKVEKVNSFLLTAG